MPKESDSSNNFGGRDKSRGIKHQKDKSKYKPKSVKDPKHVPHKLKSNLGSNWDRYDIEDDSQSPQLSSSTDFSILASAPIVQGQHFQFKQDKILAEEVENTSHDLFSLDLNMLKQSILTVPFYERMGIDKSYFTENQISSMNKDAEDSFVNYNEKFNSNKINELVLEPPVNIDNDLNETKNVEVVDFPASETTIQEEADEPQTKTNDLVQAEPRRNTDSFEEDLEQWLDDILDD